MYELMYQNLLWSQGSFIVFLLVIVSIFGLLLYRPLFWIAAILFLFSLYCFRNPTRVCSTALVDDSLLICPSDGTVIDIVFDQSGKIDGYFQKISLFLSPFDAHVLWSPMAGEIERVMYKPGNFKLALLPKASEFNEHNDVVIKNIYDKTIKVRQIAGTFGRQICCFVHAGDKIALGYAYGITRFSSRVDIFLPESVDLQVSIGQKVYGGQTVLGIWDRSSIQNIIQ